MIKTFKILSALLSYPTKELQQAAPEFGAILKEEGLLGKDGVLQICPLVKDIINGDLMDLQERYVLLFDRTRSLSLHLFEHVHGESRDRGQAMVDLKEHYENNGLFLDTNELPDYLPLFLEFLSTLPMKEAKDMLNQPVSVLAALAERLRKRDSIYERAFISLLAIADARSNTEVVKELLAQEDDDPNDLEALDREWEEEAVSFGAGAALQGQAGCGKVTGMVERLKAQMPAN